MDTLGEWLPDSLEQPSNLCASASADTPVVIDFGSYQTRIGLGNKASPTHAFKSRAAKFRDRRTGEQRSVVGNDILLEAGARNAARTPFDGPLLTNWDAAESILDYGLNLIGYDLEKPSPVAISEALLAPHLPHRTLQELMFEGYAVPRLAFGADVLGAAKYALDNSRKDEELSKEERENVLLVTLGAEAMHVLPIIKGTPLYEDARRINWGGRLASEFLHELLVLKYPNFPVPVTSGEVEMMLRKHCFVARDYRKAIREAMDMANLEKLEVRIQAPLPEHIPLDKERLERQAERRRESGRRLQEQAAIARAERQERQQQELEQLQRFEAELSELPPQDAEAHAQHAGFTNMNDVRRSVRQLNNTLRRARGEQIEDPEPKTPLLDVPDDQLNGEQLKEKRRQRLLRASYDARQRARAAKEAKRQAEEAAEAAEADWRARDLKGWARAKRDQLDEVMASLREREKIRRDPRLRFRQTLFEAAPEPKRRNGGPTSRTGSAPPPAASQGSATPTPNGDNNGGTSSASLENGDGIQDLPGANATKPEVDAEADEEEVEEEERDLEAEASALQALLLEHDPDFSLEDLEPKKPWRDSTVHKFLWGAHPLDPENMAQQYQLNLNIERMRAVEPIFQPSIVGVDQAGLSEVVAELLHRHPILASRIRLTGGFAHLKGLAERLETDIRRELPSNLDIKITTSSEPELDAWRGIASWSMNKDAYVSRRQYQENGPDYIVEHSWGNPRH